MPTKDGIRRKHRADFGEGFPPQTLSLHRESTTLVIREENPPGTISLFHDRQLSLELIDPSLRIFVDPTDEDGPKKLPRLEDHGHEITQVTAPFGLNTTSWSIEILPGQICQTHRNYWQFQSTDFFDRTRPNGHLIEAKGPSSKSIGQTINPCLLFRLTCRCGRVRGGDLSPTGNGGPVVWQEVL